MGSHSGNRVRRGLARHKKLSIVIGSVTGLAASAGIAFAVVAATTSGGNVSGSLSYAGSATQPNNTTATVVWEGAPSFSCSQADGFFQGGTSISDDGQTATVSLPPDEPIYGDAVCTLSGTVQNTGDGDADITGFTLGSATDQEFTSSLSYIQQGNVTPVSGSNPADLQAGSSFGIRVTITPDASLGNTPTSVTISGGLTYQLGPATFQK